MGTLPAFVEGFTNVARDEHRHVAFGARFLRDMAREDPRYGEAIQRTLAEVAPVADGVLRPSGSRRSARRRRDLRRDDRRDPRLRDEGAGAPAEGHRAGRPPPRLAAMPSVVRPEYGPSLPTLLGPRLRVLPRSVRAALALGGLAVLAALAVVLIARPGGPHAYVQRSPIVFNLNWDEPLRKPPPRPGELLRLEQRRGTQLLQSMTIEPLRLPPTAATPPCSLPRPGRRPGARDEPALPGRRFGVEGRVRLNPDAAGYGFVFRARLGHRQLWGRGSLLAPGDAGARLGVFILLLGTPEGGVHSTDQLGYVGPLKQPYRSFRFGTERP